MVTSTKPVSGVKKHSSISPNPHLPAYFGADCKYYYLPLWGESLFPQRTRALLGTDNGVDRSPIAMRSSLLKAVRGKFSHVKLPVDRAEDELLAQALELAAESSLPVVLQLSAALFAQPDYVNFISALPGAHEIEILLDADNLATPQLIRELRTRHTAVHISLPIHKDLRWHKLLRREVLAECEAIHLNFMYQLQMGAPYLTCVESQRIFQRLRAILPQIKFLPPRGTDLWDRRVKNNFELEPYLAPCFETNSLDPKIKYSVVIPTFNNQNLLRVTIHHLLNQDVGADAFEIIIVDDGGSDKTQPLVIKLIADQNTRFNFKYIYFPRTKKRAMGDAQFRAGIARNLGVKNAVGENLCFLDSDIVTPPDYLRKVGAQLQSWGGLQARRINLKQKVSHLDCRYENVELGRDTEADEKYWEDFIKNTQDWHLLPYNWKYVCTHSFSMKRDLFWKLGGFKRNYIFYGFEDTDLGYRLTKSGHDLHLLDVTVFHLFHETVRSEFMNLNSYRHDLLSRTAQIFYFHHLDDDIFENLRGFMNPELNFARIGHHLRGLLTLRFLWKKRAPVYSSLRELKKALKA